MHCTCNTTMLMITACHHPTTNIRKSVIVRTCTYVYQPCADTWTTLSMLWQTVTRCFWRTLVSQWTPCWTLSLAGSPSRRASTSRWGTRRSVFRLEAGGALGTLGYIRAICTHCYVNSSLSPDKIRTKLSNVRTKIPNSGQVVIYTFPNQLPKCLDNFQMLLQALMLYTIVCTFTYEWGNRAKIVKE